MYKISDDIKELSFEGLQIQRLVKTDALEILSISLEKGAIFPEHVSPKEAQLLVLEGDIDFHIDHKKYNITAQQHFNFPEERKHWVKANKNSKFLIIR